jgi:hypothetical protein
MKALRKNEWDESTAYAPAPARKAVGWTPVVIVTEYGTAAYEAAIPVTETEPKFSVRNVALFLAAPFVGLLYALAMPLVGLGALVWFAAKAVAKKAPALKAAAATLAAPFVGLLYAIAMPFAGLGALVWIAAKLLAKKVPAVKAVAATLAAPFIGLAFIVAMPVAGLGALGWVAAKSVISR